MSAVCFAATSAPVAGGGRVLGAKCTSDSSCYAIGMKCGAIGSCHCVDGYVAYNDRCVPNRPLNLADPDAVACELNSDCRAHLGEALCRSLALETGIGRCWCTAGNIFDPFTGACRANICSKNDDCALFGPTSNCDVVKRNCQCAADEIKFGVEQKCTVANRISECVYDDLYNPCPKITSGSLQCAGNGTCTCETATGRPGTLIANNDSISVHCADLKVGQLCKMHANPQGCPLDTECRGTLERSHCLCRRYHKEVLNDAGNTNCVVKVGSCCSACSDCGEGPACRRFRSTDPQGICDCPDELQWNATTQACRTSLPGHK